MKLNKYLNEGFDKKTYKDIKFEKTTPLCCGTCKSMYVVSEEKDILSCINQDVIDKAKENDELSGKDWREAMIVDRYGVCKYHRLMNRYIGSIWR